jgi:hypothetical protein
VKCDIYKCANSVKAKKNVKSTVINLTIGRYYRTITSEDSRTDEKYELKIAWATCEKIKQS